MAVDVKLMDRNGNELRTRLYSYYINFDMDSSNISYSVEFSILSTKYVESLETFDEVKTLMGTNYLYNGVLQDMNNDKTYILYRIEKRTSDFRICGFNLTNTNDTIDFYVDEENTDIVISGFEKSTI